MDKIKVVFSHSESGFCRDMYKILKYNNKPSKGYVCRMQTYNNQTEWCTYTGEPNTPLKDGLEIEITKSKIIDKVKRDGAYSFGTISFPFSWEHPK